MNRRTTWRALAVAGAVLTLAATGGLVLSPVASANDSLREVTGRVEGSRCWEHHYEFHTSSWVKGRERSVEGSGITGYCGDGSVITENHRTYCSPGRYARGCSADAGDLTFGLPYFDVVAQFPYCDDSVDPGCDALKVGYVVNRYYPNGTFERLPGY